MGPTAARALRTSDPMAGSRKPSWASGVLEDDPRASAKAAGLRYVADDEPGYTRRRCGRGFSYRDWNRRTVRRASLRDRFASLAIPPAWTEVWICRDDEGHIQATGRDDAGRKQYIYHPRWREVRDRAKFDRVVAFGRLLPRIRARVAEDLRREGLDRRRVLASVVRLLETTLARVGNDEYAQKNESYGLTTIRKKHVVHADGDEVVLEFDGKGKKQWCIEVAEPEVTEVIAECLETPGYELFKYFDSDGVKRDVTSDDVNTYLREIARARVTAKDFRTWAGTVLAAVALEELERVEPDVRHDKRLVRAVERVAEDLGNTPAICRSCYIHPEVLGDVEDDVEVLATEVRRRAKAKLRDEMGSLRPEEAAVLAYLEKRLAERASEAEAA